MDGCPLINRLNLHNHLSLHQQVQTVAAFQFDATINHRQGFLAFDLQTTFGQFESQAGLIGRFEQAWPKGAVDLNRGANDVLCELIQCLFVCHPGHLRRLATHSTSAAGRACCA